MSKYASFTIEIGELLPSDFEELKKQFRTEVIEKGLDKTINLSINKLRSDLKFLVNETIRTEPSISNASASTNELEQPTINPPKSDNDILKFLTEGKTDLSKYNKAKDYTTLSETGVVFGHGSTGQNSANRIALRMDITEGETVSTQHAKAKKFFGESIFALPDRNGQIHYYLNPGIDLSEFIKIRCSTQTGDGNTKPKSGLNPQQRFNKNKRTKNYSDWTLQQAGVEKIRNSFVDLTQAMNLIKEGEFDSAKAVLKSNDKTQKFSSVVTQIDKLQNNVGLTSEAKNYTNLLSLINNLALSKKITKENVLYTLVSTYDDIPIDQQTIEQSINSSIRTWVVDSEESWFKYLIETVEKLVADFERQK